MARAALGQLGAVGDLPGERVAEGQHPLGVELGFVEEAAVDQLAEGGVELLLAQPGGEAERSRPDLLAHHRGDLQQLLGVRVEAVDASGEDRLHGCRHAGLLDRADQAVGAALALEVAGLDQLADDLLDEERVARVRAWIGSSRPSSEGSSPARSRSSSLVSAWPSGCRARPR